MNVADLIALAAYRNQGIDRLFNGLSEAQKRFLNDTNKRKTARCGRRAGKTYLCAVTAAKLCSNDTVLYVALTRASAKNIFWGPLKQLDRTYSLGLEFNETELIARSPLGGSVIVTGADSYEELDKKRGMSYKLAILDEAGSFRVDIERLVNEIITPALMDTRGEVWLTGTPNASCQGYFHEADTALKGWTHHHWTAIDNPGVPHAKEWLESERQLRGLEESDPYYQREYMGLWVRGGNRLVYKFLDGRNTYADLPSGIDWRFVIGCDVGWVDSTAFVVQAYSPRHSTMYTVFQAKRPGMVVSEIAGVLRELRSRFPGSTTVMDTGGGGKIVAEDIMRVEKGIRIMPADKRNKISTIALLNSDLVNAKVKVLPGSPVIDEWMGLQLMENGQEDPTVHNDLADAFLYSYRECYQYLYHDKIPVPGVNAPDWGDRLEAAKVAAFEKMQRTSRRNRRWYV